MFQINVRTYNEALRFSRCLEIRKYAPNVTDRMIGDMYQFISQNPNHKVGISNGMIYYVNAEGEKSEVHAVDTVAGFDHLVLSSVFFRVVNTASSSDSGCGGCSSNNNNNNG